MAAIAATIEPTQEPRASKLTPYIPMNISGVPKDGYFVQKRLDLLVQARVKKQQITEVLLAEGTKIRYKITKHLIYCASDVLSVLSYEMARAPFGIALSYRELTKRIGRYGEKFVMVACRLLVVLGLLDPPRQLSGRDRSLTWKLPGRQALIDALVAATTESEQESCSGPHDDETLPSGKGLPKSSRATDDITCSGLAQDAPANPDVSANKGARVSASTRHSMPCGDSHAAWMRHICPANTTYMLRPCGIYAACNYSNYDSEDSAKLESNYEPQYTLVWDIDALTWLIGELCPLDRPFLEHEPKVIRGQAEQILAQTTTWDLPLEEAFKRVSRTLKYAYQQEPWFKANQDKIPFCIGKHFSKVYYDMIKKGWTPPDEADQVVEVFRQGVRRQCLFREASQLSIDLSQQSEPIIEEMALALEAAQQAEQQHIIDDPSYASSDSPYLQVFAAFNCVPQRDAVSSEYASSAQVAGGEARSNVQLQQADLVEQFLWIGEQLGYPRLKVWNSRVNPEWVECGRRSWQTFPGALPPTALRVIVRNLCLFYGLRLEEAQVGDTPRTIHAAPLSPPASTSRFTGIQEAEPITENLDEPPGMTCEEAEQVIAQMQRDKPYHKISYRTSANGGVVFAIRWSSNPNEESEWLEVHQPGEWPGVWEARAAQTWARFEEVRRQLPRPALSRSARRY